MENNSSKYSALIRNNWFVLACYTFIFLLFFLQFPLNHSLVGDIDSIGNLAIYKQMKNQINQLILGTPAGTFCYPTENIWIYFGADFGNGIIHVILSYLGIPDLWAHWLFISIIFTLNAFTLYLLLQHFFKNRRLVFGLSLIFNFSHFILGNLESANTLIFFLSFLSLHFYLEYVDEKSKYYLSIRKFGLSVFLGSIQMYLAPYNFVIHIFVWSLFIVNYERPLFNYKTILRYFTAILSIALVISPYLYLFVFTNTVSDANNVNKIQDFIHAHSMNLDDYFRVLNGHLYLKHEVMNMNPLISKLRAGYIGIAFYLVAGIGLLRKQNRVIAILLIVVGFILATGPYISINNNRQFPFILYKFYEWFNLYELIRIPFRFFFIPILGLTILVGNGIIILKNRTKFKYLGFLIICLILIENVPFQMETYNHKDILSPDKEFIKTLLQTEDETAVLHLPSSSNETFKDYRREYIYQYWQHFHRKNILNGTAAFIPDDRKKIDDLINGDHKDLCIILEDYGVNYVFFHKDQVNDKIDLSILQMIEENTHLMKTNETERTITFKVED